MDSHTLKRISLYTILTVFTLYLMTQYWPALANVLGTLWSAAIPFIIGGMVAFVVNIVMKIFEEELFSEPQKSWKRRLRRPISLTLAYLSFVLAIVLILGIAVPEMYRSVATIIKQNANLFKDLKDVPEINQFLNERLASFQGLTIPMEGPWQEQLKTFNETFGKVTLTILSSLTTVFSSFFSLVVIIIFSIYLLMDKERLTRQMSKIIRVYLPQVEGPLIHIGKVSNKIFKSYIAGQSTEALITGILCFICLKVFGFPFAGSISVITGFFTLIPFFGAIIGSIFGFLLILTVSLKQAIWFMVFIVILQQVEGNIIYPKVVGDSVGLPAIWVFASVSIGSSFGGIIGMLLAVPITATIYKLMSDHINNKYDDRHPQEENA